MRIIAGSCKGRRLHAPKGDRIRPTIDRVRESIFNIIALEVPQAAVLDLFAGTGAMGLEALSRGAQSCVFVDQGAESVRLIRENIDLCGLGEKSRVIQSAAAPAIRRLESEGEAFDIIFLDPPYGRGLVESTLAILGPVAREDALAVAELSVKDVAPDVSGAWKKDLERRYGDTLISIYRKI